MLTLSSNRKSFVIFNHGKKITCRTPAESNRLSTSARILHFINPNVQSNNFTGQNYWLTITCGICKYPSRVQPYSCSLLITFSKSYQIPQNLHTSSSRESGKFANLGNIGTTSNTEQLTSALHHGGGRGSRRKKEKEKRPLRSESRQTIIPWCQSSVLPQKSY